MRSPARPLIVAVAVGAAAMCGLRAAEPTLSFTDITRQSGIRFTHNSSAFGKKFLPETMGAGVVFFDADGDG